MKQLVIFLLIIFNISCQTKSKQSSKKGSKTVNKHQTIEFMPKLSGTKWEFQIAKGCTNFYEFINDREFKFYSCETEDSYYGDYYVKSDTLYTHELISSTDSLKIYEEREHKFQPLKYKIILKHKKLKHIEKWSYSNTNGIWKKDDFVFNDSILYRRVGGNGNGTD